MDILAIGEPLLELNTNGPLETAETFAVGYGGDTSNFVVAARRSGASAGYVTRIGDDAFGTVLYRLWEREGVATDHVIREPGGSTGVYFIAKGGGFTYRRANSPATRLSAADLPKGAIVNARLVHVTGITQAISTCSCDMSFQLMRIARRANTFVSYDPNYRAALWPAERARAVVMRSVELCDIALPNLEEGRLLTEQHEPEDVLAAFVRRGPSIVVLKMGADGALLAHDGDVTRIPPYRVTELDPSGAGDTFDGAFAARLLDGATPVEAAGYAAVAAALTTTGPGAVLPIPNRSEVDSRLAASRGPS